MGAMLYSFAGVLIGCFVTLFLSQKYYIKYGKQLDYTASDLEKEVALLKKHSDWLIKVMQKNGWVNLEMDSEYKESA